jgi:autotransporter-associated beta strand protein
MTFTPSAILESAFTPMLLPFLGLILVAQAALADGATWNLNPTNDDWFTATNWTPANVPNEPSETATFGVSNLAGVSLSHSTEINGIVFSPGASAFTITVQPTLYLTMTGAGVTNNAGITQNFVTAVDGGGNRGQIAFALSATAGNGTAFTNPGGLAATNGGGTLFTQDASAGSATFINGGGVNVFGQGGVVSFYDSSTAAEATIINNGGTADDTEGGITTFDGTATAANGTFTSNGGAALRALGGIMEFSISATAGNASFTSNGAVSSGAKGALTEFLVDSTAANGSFTNNAGTVAGAGGAVMLFADDSTAENATLIANGGPVADTGASIQFRDNSKGDWARVEVFGNGNLDISFHDDPNVTVGSIEGDGNVFLGGNSLTVGRNKLSTLFSGVIQDGGLDGGTGGSLAKIGTGRLTLTGANTYTAGTTVERGGLQVSNTTGSGTGDGPVHANAGKLSGSGIIAGAVTIGTGTGSGASLSPGNKPASLRTFKIRNTLTFNADAIYDFGLDSAALNADKVIAHGTAINSGALFSLTDFGGNATLPPGTTFTAISNTAAEAISGRFSNLPDGGTITVGNNTFQADYEGGDGNDLTLTVAP